jgi:hypothetical protein
VGASEERCGGCGCGSGAEVSALPGIAPPLAGASSPPLLLLPLNGSV